MKGPPPAGALRGKRIAAPGWIEYAFYAEIFYGEFAIALGIWIPALGGAVVALLAVACIFQAGKQAVWLYRSLTPMFACAGTLIAIQLFIHGEPSVDIRPFVLWIFTAILTHTLSLRPGFLRRFTTTAALLGVSLVPYVHYAGAGVGVERAVLDSSMSLAMSNSNDLAAWFGFCAVYFTTAGIESTRNAKRLLWWAAALPCLYMVSLTVSRGTLLACALAAVFAGRGLLKRRFVPALCLVLLVSLAYLSGVFDFATDMYRTRGLEETGRLIVWPLALARFLDAPLFGIGMSQVGTYVASVGHEITPHNSFLFIALGSGLVPLAFFVTYWIRAARSVLRLASCQPTEVSPYTGPLLIFAFVQAMIGNSVFMSSWAIVTFSVALTGAGQRLGPAPQRLAGIRGRRLGALSPMAVLPRYTGTERPT